MFIEGGEEGEEGRKDLEADRMEGPDMFIKERGRTNRSCRGGSWGEEEGGGRVTVVVKAGCFLFSNKVEDPVDPEWEEALRAKERRRS